MNNQHDSTRELLRLNARLDDLQRRHRQAMRGRMVPSAEATRLQRQILETDRQIAVEKQRQSEWLQLCKAPIDDVLEVIAVPLLADVLNDVVSGVDGMLRRQGCQETIFTEYTLTIRRAAMAIVDTLEHSREDLPRLLEYDDTLVDAVKKKIMSFIRQRLNIVS